MSKRALNLEIECGEITCASEPGKFCRFLTTRRFGTVHFCRLWYDQDEKGRPLPLDTVDGSPEGWLKRRPECLAAEYPMIQYEIRGAE